MFVVVMPPAPVRFHATCTNTYSLLKTRSRPRPMVMVLLMSVAPTLVAVVATCCDNDPI
jgi:hypothetical protein